MGDTYEWRAGSVKFDMVGSWDDQTTGQSPATTIPGSSDTAVMDGTGSVSGTGDVLTLDVGGSFTFTASITADTGITFAYEYGPPEGTTDTISGGTLDGGTAVNISADTVDVTNGGMLATNTGTASAGALSDDGALTVDNGSVATTVFFDSGAFSLSDGTADVFLMTVGDSSSATTLDIGSGGTLTDSSANIGASTGDDASATVQSGGVWTNSDNLDIGLLSDGEVDVEADGTVDVLGGGDALAALLLGLGAGSNGSIDIDGGSMSVTGNADIGTSGTGDLSISGGGSLDVTGTLDTGVAMGSSGTLSVGDDGAALTVGDYTIGDGGAHSDSITGSVSVEVSGTLTLGAQNTGTGTLTLSGSPTLSVGGAATIGNAGHGDLELGQGSAVTIDGALTLAGTATGTGTISIGQDVSLAPGGGITVGSAGTASITLAEGATLDGSAGAFVLGGTTAAAGTITLAGAGATVVADALTVGATGTGVISIAASTTLSTSGNLTLGQTHGGGNGTVTVAGSGDLAAGGNVDVGAGGVGSLDVNGGSLSISGTLGIADSLASSGDVTFAQSTLSIGTITVGGSGSGTFSGDNAADVQATQIIIGAAGVGSGTFSLDGAGSEADAGAMQVGNAGTGALQVTDSALMQVTGLATMGATSSSHIEETATIESNASWTDASILDVAQKGAAVITIDTGGQVAAPTVILGDDATASGTIMASGTGTLPSALDFGTLQVGNLGTGSLMLASGAEAGTADTAGTVEIAAGTSAAGGVTLTGSGTKLQAAILAVGGGATSEGGTGNLSVATGSTVDAGAAVVWENGTITMAGGLVTTDPLTIDGNVSGFGKIAGTVINNGMITMHGGALTLSGSLSGSGVLDFSGTATLVLGKPGSGLAAPVLGLDAGDKIELAGLTITGATLTSPGTVTVTTSGADYLLTDVGFEAGAVQSFKTGHDAATGDDFIKVACFAAGTRILTASGEVAVETLSPGDLIVTRAGRRRPIKWLGHRRIEPARHPRPHEVHPIRVQANAFAPGMPHTDLLLSPDHALYWRGALIPVRYLVNGATIRQQPVAEIFYYHIELNAHDVLFAEGLTAESYLDTGNRAAFANGGATVHAHADFARAVWRKKACAPLIADGLKLRLTQRHLLNRAAALGHAQTDEPDLHLLADGASVWPQIDGAGKYHFTLPRPAASLRLVSRSVVPAEIYPGNIDARRLGVAVAHLAVDGQDVPANDPRRAAGWHPPEPGVQWTDGDARLACTAASHVQVMLRPLLRYWRPPDATAASPRSFLC